MKKPKNFEEYKKNMKATDEQIVKFISKKDKELLKNVGRSLISEQFVYVCDYDGQIKVLTQYINHMMREIEEQFGYYILNVYSLNHDEDEMIMAEKIRCNMVTALKIEKQRYTNLKRAFTLINLNN